MYHSSLLAPWSLVLAGPQLVVQGPGVCKQLGVGPLLRHAAPLQHQDLVTVDHRAQPVRDDDGGAALRGRGQRRHDAVLRDRVQAGGGLVKHQNGGVLQNSPRNGNSLLLTACSWISFTAQKKELSS